MNEQNVPGLGQICAQLEGHRLPRWEELPDLDLYMDQVLSLIDRYLGSYPGFDEKGLTASMVNNYVKLSVMPAPVKKKYTRSHLAHLIVICLLKTTLPIADIEQLIAQQRAVVDEARLYDRFCDMFEASNGAVAATALSQEPVEGDKQSLASSLFMAALRAQAERALALKLMGTVEKSEP